MAACGFVKNALAMFPFRLNIIASPIRKRFERLNKLIRILKTIMKNEAKLGTIPNGDEGRDAVHVAIVPIRAATKLFSGSPVRLNARHEAESCCVEDAIGVVDPFMPEDKRHVAIGSWFWLCLYPKTITGLRHVWDHPSFPVTEITAIPVANDAKRASEEWLKAYVRKHCTYWEDEPDDGYSIFLRYVTNEHWIFYAGSDCHDLSDVEDSDELFRHLSIVLERRIDASYFEAFTCTC